MFASLVELDKVQDFCRGRNGNSALEAQAFQKGKEYLVIINPHSGNGNAVWSFHYIIKPMFTSCGAKLSEIHTKHAKHISELGQQAAKEVLAGVSTTKNVLICGGDGSFQEYINGAINAASHGDMTVKDTVQTVLKSINLAPIPCGSCNGLSISLGNRTVYDACISILYSQKLAPLDLWKINYLDRKRQKLDCNFDVHVISTGIGMLLHEMLPVLFDSVVAETDYLQETTFRCLGTTLKGLIVPLCLILQKNTFGGKLYIKPFEGHLQFDDTYKAEGYSDPNQLEDVELDNEIWKKIGAQKEYDKYCYILSTNAPWGASDALIHPSVKLDDCSSTLVVIYGDVTRWQLIKSFMTLETGKHIHLDYVHLYRIAEFMLVFERGKKYLTCFYK